MASARNKATPFTLNPNKTPLAPFFVRLKEEDELPGSHHALIRAVMADNLPAVKKHLALGADPTEGAKFSFVAGFYAGGFKKTVGDESDESNYRSRDALEAAARSACDPEIVRALVAAAFALHPGSDRPRLALAKAEEAWRDHGGPGYDGEGKTYFFWGVMTDARHKKTARSFVEAIPPEAGLPWKTLAQDDYLEEELVAGIQRLADAPEAERLRLANEALAVCSLHGREKALIACLQILGPKADTQSARVEAAIAKNAALEAQLALPIHAYAIGAGETEWPLKALESADRSWVGSPAPLRPYWTPLAAALERCSNQPDPSGLCQSLIKAGAPIEALTESAHAKAPVPLLAQRAMAGDASGVRLLLLAKASISSLNELVSLRSGGKSTALGVAALAGDEEMTRLLLSAGADPRAIPASQLRAIAAERPELRSLLGDESALSAFSRSVSGWASRLLSPAKPAEAPSQPASPSADGSASAGNPGAALDVALTLSLAHAARLPHGLLQRIGELAQSARELAPDGDLPADPADAPQLRRLWESNIPRFLSRLIEIPLADRSALGDGGEPPAQALLEGMLEAADASMGLMRQRALQGAHTRLAAEAAVIYDNAGQTLQSFQELIGKSQERAASATGAIPGPITKASSP